MHCYLQNLSSIYDMELMIRCFVTGEGWYLDQNRMGICLFPIRVPQVGGRQKSRRDDETGGILTNLDEIGKFSTLLAKSISGHVPHATLGVVLSTCLNI